MAWRDASACKWHGVGHMVMRLRAVRGEGHDDSCKPFTKLRTTRWPSWMQKQFKGMGGKKNSMLSTHVMHTGCKPSRPSYCLALLMWLRGRHCEGAIEGGTVNALLRQAS
eukprot:1159412-Pelagomonas_calceolata.AAC.12